ncbi:hypothetical protein R3P38DRAFT_2760847 [Favolaschia claudopus]|uniref:Uncharacterized protein n=1 Tax=Favolaschia claudopus TaxID=2862362 RepID=A0AAW0DT07_9AGAR
MGQPRGIYDQIKTGKSTSKESGHTKSSVRYPLVNLSTQARRSALVVNVGLGLFNVGGIRKKFERKDANGAALRPVYTQNPSSRTDLHAVIFRMWASMNLDHNNKRSPLRWVVPLFGLLEEFSIPTTVPHSLKPDEQLGIYELPASGWQAACACVRDTIEDVLRRSNDCLRDDCSFHLKNVEIASRGRVGVRKLAEVEFEPVRIESHRHLSLQGATDISTIALLASAAEASFGAPPPGSSTLHYAVPLNHEACMKFYDGILHNKVCSSSA